MNLRADASLGHEIRHLWIDNPARLLTRSPVSKIEVVSLGGSPLIRAGKSAANAALGSYYRHRFPGSEISTRIYSAMFKSDLEVKRLELQVVAYLVYSMKEILEHSRQAKSYQFSAYAADSREAVFAIEGPNRKFVWSPLFAGDDLKIWRLNSEGRHDLVRPWVEARIEALFRVVDGYAKILDEARWLQDDEATMAVGAHEISQVFTKLRSYDRTVF
jgi:hypothetical protein